MTALTLDKLPDEFVKEVLLYLKPGELFAPIMLLNKKLHKLANDSMLQTQSFFNYLKVPFDYGGVEFALLRRDDRCAQIKKVMWKKAESEKLQMLAYYTDGGVDGNTSTYFMQNIYVEKPIRLYCSIRGENVNIKSTVSQSIQSKIDFQNIKKFKVPKSKLSFYPYPDHTYRYPLKSLVSSYEPELHKQFSVLKFHDLNRNLTSYTCFLQSFVIFVSMTEIDTNHPLVKLFEGVKKIDQIDKLGFEYSILQETTDTKVIEFNLHSLKKVSETLNKSQPGAKLNGVYPVIWGDVCRSTANYLNLSHPIGFKHILMKLIDSHKTTQGGNIDCYTISLAGNIIKLKHTNEE